MQKLLVALAVLLAVGCTKKEDDGNLMVYHGSHRDDVKTWDPANAYDDISLDVLPSIYETLYQYAYLSETYKIVPLLAADMPKFSSDHLTVTIPIIRGVKFQDDPSFKESNGKGRELRAQDFVYAFKRLALPSLQSQGWWIFDNKIAGIAKFHDLLVKTPRGDVPKIFANTSVEGIRALDDYTLQLKLTKPYPQLLYILALSFTSPVANEAVTAYGDENGNLVDHPIGTGPFILARWEHGKKIILERNPTFHQEKYPDEGNVEYRKKGLLADAGKPLPFLDRVVIDVIKERQPAWQSFLRGDQDLIEIPRDNFPQAITNRVNLSSDLAGKGIRLSIETAARFFYVSFNMKDKLLGSNKALRQAISSAIDRDKWIDVFTNGTGRKAETVLPPGIPDRISKPKLKYGYDLVAAKELLKKAGYPEAKGLPTLNFDMRGADSLNRQLGEYFQSQLGAIGIKLNMIYNTFPAYLEKMRQGNLQISYGGWGMDYPDPENAYQLLYGANQSPGPNEANFDNQETNKLYEQISAMEPGSKRAALIEKMDSLVQEESPWALGYYHTYYRVSNPWLLNFRGSEIINNPYKYYRVNRDVKRRYLETK